MICTKKDHQGGEHCVTCVEHACLKRLGERRRERNIKNGKLEWHVDTAAIGSLNDFWAGWIDTFGKEKATDYLLAAMRTADEALRAQLNAPKKRTQGKVQYEKVSAPRLED